MIGVHTATPKGVALGDQLWGMASDGKTLKEIGEYALNFFIAQGINSEQEIRDQDPTGMEYAVIVMTSALGIGLIK